jgi:hypothetical protein
MKRRMEQTESKSFTILHNTVLQIKVTEIIRLEWGHCDKTLHIVLKKGEPQLSRVSTNLF